MTLRMAEVHTCKDQEITQKEVETIQQRLSGHVSMWIKMLGIGESWGHTDRMRETLINHSVLITPLYLLAKDHKPLKKDGCPPTRPVVSGCKGMNHNLNDVLSDCLDVVNRNCIDKGEDDGDDTEIVEHSN